MSTYQPVFTTARGLFALLLLSASGAPASASTLFAPLVEHATWHVQYSLPPGGYTQYSVTQNALSFDSSTSNPPNVYKSSGALLFEVPTIPVGEKIVSLNLNLKINGNTYDGTYLVNIEALAREPGDAPYDRILNPHIYSAIGPFAEPCLSGHCSEPLGIYGFVADYLQSHTRPYISSDVSGAISLLAPNVDRLQFNLIGYSGTGLVFDSAGLGGNLPYLAIETAPIPEPSTATLIGVGLAGIALTHRPRASR